MPKGEVMARTLLETGYRRKGAATRLRIIYKAMNYKVRVYGL
jgi:hypothetical protein